MRRHALFELAGALLDSVPPCIDVWNAMLADPRGAARATHDQRRR